MDPYSNPSYPLLLYFEWRLNRGVKDRNFMCRIRWGGGGESEGAYCIPIHVRRSLDAEKIVH